MKTIAETDMLKPVLTLFPRRGFNRFEQVPLGRKRIDLVCVDRSSSTETAVELKISDWRKALWQAAVNFQLADYSYIALWHEFVHRPQAELELLSRYGIGLISVHRTRAEVVLASQLKVRRIPRANKAAWYQTLISHSQ